MFLSFIFTALCALPFSALLLLILLLMTGLDCYLNDGRSLSSCFVLVDRLFKCIWGGGLKHQYLHLASFALLAAYLLIPMGSLPPYIRTPVNPILLIVILAFSQSAYIKGVRVFASDVYQRLDANEHSALSGFGSAFIAVYGSLAWFVLDRGVPGSLISLDSVAAMPIWNIAGIYGKAGIICFLLLFAIVSPRRGPDDIRLRYDFPFFELHDVIRSGFGPTISVALFLPWNPAIWLGLHGPAMFTLDFVFFWMKVFVLQVLVFPLINKLFLKIKSNFPGNTAKISICVAGVVFFLIDLH